MQDAVSTRFVAMFPEVQCPVTVHRLDMETSGLLIMARTREAHSELSRQFRVRTEWHPWTQWGVPTCMACLVLFLTHPPVCTFVKM